MNRRSCLLASLALSLGLLFPSAWAQDLVIKGSDTLGARLVPQLSEAFRLKNPDAPCQIAADGSTTGIAAIIDGTAAIGMVSRPIRPTEASAAAAKGVSFTPTLVALDGIAVIVNAACPVKALSKKQVEQIFAGDVTDWSALGGKPGKISIYTRNTASGTYIAFKDLAMHRRDYGSSCQKMAGNEQIASEIARNPDGIGYVGLAYAHTPGVRALVIDGTALSEETVRSKAYPYTRATYYFTNGAPAGRARLFLDFTLSDEGQKIARQVGFVPIH